MSSSTITATFYYLFLIIFILGIVLVAMGMPQNDDDDDNDNIINHANPKPLPNEKQKIIENQKSSTQTQPIFAPEKNLNEKKGMVGEKIIEVLALTKLNREIYHHFKDLIIPNGNRTTQIDNIIVSQFGIFVIEVKYTEGWIYGQENEHQWTLTRSHSHKIKIGNPLKQNQIHIKALAKLLRLSETQFHSVVVFAHRNCQIKTKLPDNVCLQNNFIDYIQSFKDEICNQNTIQAAKNILTQDDWSPTPERLAKHIAQFQN